MDLYINPLIHLIYPQLLQVLLVQALQLAEEAEERNPLSLEKPKTENCFLTSPLLHWGHRISSEEESTSFSKRRSHLPHTYSYMGIFSSHNQHIKAFTLYFPLQ